VAAAARNLYRRYLSSVMGFDVSHTRLSKMSDSLLDKFYLSSDPTAPPSCLAFNPEGVSRVERAAGRRVVILRRLGKWSVAKLHDLRCYDSAGGGGDETFAGPALVLSAEYDRKARGWTLDRWSGDLPDDSRLYEQKFIAPGVPSPEGCCALEKALLAAGSAAEEDRPAHQHVPECRDLVAFCTNLDAFSGSLPAGGIVVVSHLRTKMRARHSWLPRDQTFGVLGTARVGGERPTVVSFTSDGRWAYRLKPEYASSVLDVLREREGRGPPRIPLSSIAGAAEGGGDDEESFTKTTGHGVDCDCGPCSRASQFTRHMELGGRQKLYSFPLSSFQHLETMGLLSSATQEAVLACCDLSTASFDAEAMTVAVESAGVGNEDLRLPFAPAGTTKYPREVTARQEPILLAWTDHLRDSAGLPIHVYDVDDEGVGDSLFPANFVEDLMAGRDAAAAAKRERLSDLYEFLATFKRAHSAFFAPADADPERDRKLAAVEAAWRHNPFGLFETQLDNLVSRYLCFGFNR
jgi:hypothetical protein